MSDKKKLSRSHVLAAKLMYAALSILHNSGKEMPVRELLARVEQQVEIDDWVEQGLRSPVT